MLNGRGSLRFTRTALVALVKMDHFASVHHLGESSEEQLATVFANVDLARAHLMVEPDAELIAQQFEQLFRAFTAIRIIEGQEMDPQIRLADVQSRQDKFAQESIDVREAIHTSLKLLDQPVRTVQRRLTPA
jgi:hypothetical protein